MNHLKLIIGILILVIAGVIASAVIHHRSDSSVRVYNENIEQNIAESSNTWPTAEPAPASGEVTPAPTAVRIPRPTAQAAASAASSSAAAAEHFQPTGPAEPVSADTPIMGTATVSADQLYAYLKSINPDAPNYAQIYLDEGAAEGVRGDIAFAQSCLETGHWQFGNDVSASQNNFSGIGATGGGAAGNSFPSPEIGIRAQIQHLQAYASTAPLKGTCVDPRYEYIERGCAPTIAGLRGRWASSSGYDTMIVDIMNKIINFNK